MFQALFTPRSGTGAIMPVMRAAVCSLRPREPRLDRDHLVPSPVPAPPSCSESYPASLARSDPEGSDQAGPALGPRAMNVPGP